jgi:hypothetical protein
MLTVSQLAVLRDAVHATFHYDIEILVGTLHGRQRTVVLLGENHDKGPFDAEVGRRIVVEFPYYALEGLDMERFRGGTLCCCGP